MTNENTPWPAAAKFAFGDRVRKHSGSWWEGRIVGFYSTKQTPIGYDIQMDMVPNGPTQIYPEAALELAPEIDTQPIGYIRKVNLQALREDGLEGSVFISRRPADHLVPIYAEPPTAPASVVRGRTSLPTHHQTSTKENAMNFGHAIDALKVGNKVARAGWNGKGMFLIYVPGTPNITPREGTPYASAVSGSVNIEPHIDLKNAAGDMQPGWNASQPDMLAEDWEIVQ